MKSVSRYISTLWLVFVLAAPMLHAQSTAVKAYQQRQQFLEASQQPELRFSEVRSYFSGDTLHLSFRVGISGQLIGRGEALHIVPAYEVATQQQFLPEILIQGRMRDSYYRREIELMDKESYLATRPYQVVVLDGKRTDEHFEYTGALYLPQALRNELGQLKIYQILEDCCNLRELGAYEIEIAGAPQPVEALPTPAPVVPKEVPLPALRLTPADLVFIQPEAEAVKVRAERMTVRIQFKVARHEILPAFSTNASELNRVRELLQPLLYGKPGDIEVTEASIRGYASPEGGFEYNQKLSERRAMSFKSYLQAHYGGLGKLTAFPAIGMGEDWAGLREALINTPNVPMREEMIAIIDYVDIFAGREKQLMDLAGGRPYRYMLEYLYPPLRRMEMEIGYRVRGYLPDEVEAIFQSRPQDLSQAEIYEVAKRRNSTRTPLAQYGKEYDVAADYFPHDLTANLNASSAALIRGEYTLAWRYLQRIADAPEASLNLALYYWQTGDKEQTLHHLDRALQVPHLAQKARTLLRHLR